MNWSFLLAVLSSAGFVKVLYAEEAEQKIADHEPLVAMWCSKVNQHIDLTNGKWVSDKNGHSMCSTSPEQVLRYCKHVYPKLDVHNIVEANKEVLIQKWCEPSNATCNATKTVTPYRCLVGNFDADALLVPKDCRFEHLHRGDKCKVHNHWRDKAAARCKEQGLVLSDYGVLLPCDTNKGPGFFTGVEFVCCPSKASNKLPADGVKTVPLMEIEEPTPMPTTAQPTSVLQKLEKEIKMFSKKVLPKSIGCDMKKLHALQGKIQNEQHNRMKKVIKKWEEAEKRYNILYKDNKDEAAAMMAGEMSRFNKTIFALEEQAKMERQQLHEERHQCMQININDKRHKAIKSLIRELKKSKLDPNAVLSALRRFMKICTEDRIHNRRHFDQMSTWHPDQVNDLRKTLKSHLKSINLRVNETMSLLYKLPSVMRKFYFELPAWVPKPVLPTEPPTEPPTEKTEPPTTEEEHIKPEDLIPLELEKRFKGHRNEKDDKHGKRFHHAGGKHGKPKKQTDPEDEPEDERNFFGEPRSPATFAAVIGLSCGALVIMIIIIVAMAMRKSRGSSPTKTVLVDADADGNSEKQRLTNLQENGYENPTYKFYDY